MAADQVDRDLIVARSGRACRERAFWVRENVRPLARIKLRWERWEYGIEQHTDDITRPCHLR